MYFRLFSYGRYLNQRNLEEKYFDAFGKEQTVVRRQDVQLNKFFAPFSGWFLSPKMRYYLYVWSSNPSQGDPAQVVGAGNLTWSFNRFASVGIENSQIRLTDGSVIFTPDLFGPGITVNEVDYRMMSIDSGVKYKGLSVEGEVYLRWLRNFTGVNTEPIADINDKGYQLQVSAVAIPKILQLYVGNSQVFGRYGNQWEGRVGENFYQVKERGVRLNGEFMYVNRSPVGYTAFPTRSGPRARCSTSTSRSTFNRSRPASFSRAEARP